MLVPLNGNDRYFKMLINLKLSIFFFEFFKILIVVHNVILFFLLRRCVLYNPKGILNESLITKHMLMMLNMALEIKLLRVP